MPITIDQLPDYSGYNGSDLVALVDTSEDTTVKSTLDELVTSLEPFRCEGLVAALTGNRQLTASDMNQMVPLYPDAATYTCKLPDTSTLSDGDVILLALFGNNNIDIDDYNDTNLYTLTTQSDYVWLVHINDSWVEMGRSIT